MAEEVSKGPITNSPGTSVMHTAELLKQSIFRLEA